MLTTAVKNLHFAMQAIPSVQPLAAMAPPNLLAADKSLILKIVENAGFRSFNHSSD